MSTAQEWRSAKGHRDENFPVASLLLAPDRRRPVMTFYRFARTADDVADHPNASAAEKLAILDRMRATLAGEAADEPTALALREALEARGLSPQHGLDLLTAFRRDVTQDRYASWEELMDYCRYSAAPVGRMVLDIHGESRSAWPASDALCAALQVINHLQDSGKDHRELDRVYLPLSDLTAAGASVEALDQPSASPSLRRALATLAKRAETLLASARPLASQVTDLRLRLEIILIQTLAEDLARRLARHDPLSERVHHRKADLPGLILVAAARALHTRGPRPMAPQQAEALP
jgi:squalene synthase HpnC